MPTQDNEPPAALFAIVLLVGLFMTWVAILDWINPFKRYPEGRPEEPDLPTIEDACGLCVAFLTLLELLADKEFRDRLTPPSPSAPPPARTP